MSDCISRQAVIESICKQYTEHNTIVPIWLSIGDLPSVTPTERTGHWIYRDGEGIYFNLYSCSECGFLCGTPTYNYCPNCGARMQESEE